MKGKGKCMDRRLRLIIADHHSLVGEACKLVLEPDFNVVEVVSDGRSLVAAAMRLKPDGIILEVRLKQLNGLEAADQIRRKLPFTKIFFMSSILEADAAAEAFRRGASGYLLKHSGVEEFRSAVRRVMRGESYLSPLIARGTLEYALNPPKRHASRKHLTPRQSEILQLLAEGNSMKQIAEVLMISAGTVAFHKYSMMENLGIRSNAELLTYAIRNHMAPERESCLAFRHCTGNAVPMRAASRA
jgi:DNA-binding NarL/FixJ family response regulator